MAGAKLKKFCRIFPWVEIQDAAFAGAIRDLCAEGSLSGGRRAGATFLLPTKAVRAEIVKKAYSLEAEEAIRLLDAHIIPEAVRAPEDWRAGVGSRLGIKLEGTASGDEVTLNGGAKIKVADDFIPLRKDNIAAWKVVSGEVALEGEAYTAPKTGRGEYSGGAGGAGGARVGGRAALAATVEETYDQCMRADKCQKTDPYLTHAVSLLNFLKQSYPELLKAVLPVADRDPAVTFYLLVEPYKTSGACLLGDDILFGPGGWNGAMIFESAVSEFAAFFDAAGASDPRAVRAATDVARLAIVGEDGRKANRVTTPRAVVATYEALVSQNTIGGVHPVLPEASLALVSGAKKLWQDELRFILHASLMEMRGEPVYEAAQFAEIVRMLRHGRPGNNYSAEAALSNGEALQQNVAPTAEFALLLKFVNSSDFLYTTVPADIVGGAWGEVPVTSEMYNASTLDVYNAEASKKMLLDAYVAAGHDTPKPLDAGAMAAVRHYVAAHGSLPPGLA